MRRDPTHLLVGCNPGVVLPDRPGLYAFLRRLDGTADVATLRRQRGRQFGDLTGDLMQVLRPLLALGLIVDLDAGAAETRQPTVGLRYDTAATALAGSVGQALADLHVDVGPEPDVTVVLSGAEPRRAPLAAMVRAGQAHLTVSLNGPTVRIGPWVVPGRTPCVECLDLHRATWDPVWSALVPQFGQRVRSSAVSAAVRLAAAGVVIDEIARFTAGVPPRSWSSVLVVDSGLQATVAARSVFHPRCSCAVLLAA